MSLDGFAAFILTNGRPDRVHTIRALKTAGYTGLIYLLVDDLDKTLPDYRARYGEQVVVFDKKAIAKTFDQADNFNDMRAIIYARNASFEVAKQLGLSHFIQLDDDYTNFTFQFDSALRYRPKTVRNMDAVLAHVVEFLEASGAASVAIAQGGDFIGGDGNQNAEAVRVLRKCMNTFVCATARPFQFIGRINEDVNTYAHKGSKGLLFFTLNQVKVSQLQTQSNTGGMTELYLDSGTYLKSFYTLLFQPSSVKVRTLRDRLGARLHHSISWRQTVPKILPESLRKPAKAVE